MMEKWNHRERCVVLGEYLLENGATVRAAAQVFGISKSTVHKDVTQHLKTVNQNLYLRVGELLLKHKQERHLRGGEATKRKYERDAVHLHPDLKGVQNLRFD